jgi:hypothetical protein
MIISKSNEELSDAPTELNHNDPIENFLQNMDFHASYSSALSGTTATTDRSAGERMKGYMRDWYGWAGKGCGWGRRGVDK